MRAWSHHFSRATRILLRAIFRLTWREFALYAYCTVGESQGSKPVWGFMNTAHTDSVSWGNGGFLLTKHNICTTELAKLILLILIRQHSRRGKFTNCNHSYNWNQELLWRHGGKRTYEEAPTDRLQNSTIRKSNFEHYPHSLHISTLHTVYTPYYPHSLQMYHYQYSLQTKNIPFPR